MKLLHKGDNPNTMLAFALLMAQTNSTPPKVLDAETFAQVKAYASPNSSDLAFQQLNWHTQIIDGLIAGHKEDKPVIMWMYFGDPRGHC